MNRSVQNCTYTEQALKNAQDEESLRMPTSSFWNDECDYTLQDISQGEQNLASPTITCPASQGLASEVSVEEGTQDAALQRFTPV